MNDNERLELVEIIAKLDALKKRLGNRIDGEFNGDCPQLETSYEALDEAIVTLEAV